MERFDFAQFKVLAATMRRGEESEDSAGLVHMAAGGKTDPMAQKAMLVVTAVVLAGTVFGAGRSLGEMGVPASAAFGLSVAGMLAVMLLVGFYQAVNTLFFARDLPFYLTLPVSAPTVMWAKLANFALSALPLEAIMLPLPVGALWAAGARPGEYAVTVLAYLFAAATTTVVLAVLTIVLMRFSRLARDKDRFARFFVVVVTVLALAICCGAGLSAGPDGQVDASGIAGAVAQGPAFVAVSVLCPPNALGSMALAGDPAQAAACFAGMAACAAAYGLLLNFVGGKWYFEGVRAMQSGGKKSSRRLDSAQLASAAAPRSQFRAFVKKDMATMVRVPAFFNQFVVTPLIMPAIMLVCGFAGAVSAGGLDLGGMRALMAEAAPGSPILLAALFLAGVLAFFSGLVSYLFALAPGRDGADFWLLRAMPVDWGAYARAKFAAGSLVGRAPFAVILLAGLLVLGFPLASAALVEVFFVCAVAAVDLVMLTLGMRDPDVRWESESQLVNVGKAYGMLAQSLVASLVALALPAAVIAAPFLLEIDASAAAQAVLATLIAVVEAALAARRAFGRGVEPLARVEP